MKGECIIRSKKHTPTQWKDFAQKHQRRISLNNEIDANRWGYLSNYVFTDEFAFQINMKRMTVINNKSKLTTIFGLFPI